jgi:SOS response regulatory protein OraA/RecX
MDLDFGNPTVAEAMDMAMRWLEVRGRSRAQVEARLQQAGFSPAVAEHVGTRLTELGILSDRAFALAAVESGLRRGLSRSYLRHGLEGQGVGAEDVTWALEESGNQDPDTFRALELAEAWIRAHPLIAAEQGPRAFRRLGGMLVRKGYEEELAGDICRTVLGEPSGFGSSLDPGPGDVARPGAGGRGQPGAGEGGSIDPPWGRS